MNWAPFYFDQCVQLIQEFFNITIYYLSSYSSTNYLSFIYLLIRDLRSQLDREISERTVEGDHLKHLIEENAKVLIFLSILYLEQLIEEYLKEFIYLFTCPFPL